MLVDPSAWNTLPWALPMAGSFSLVLVQLQRQLPVSLQLVACHPPATGSAIYTIFTFFPALITIWKVLVFDVYFWSSFFPLRRQALWGLGQWLLCFLKFLWSPISAWYLTEALKPSRWIHAVPGVCRLSSLRALLLQRIMLQAASAHYSVQN